jgi:hypothetical protein
MIIPSPVHITQQLLKLVAGMRIQDRLSGFKIAELSKLLNSLQNF